MIDAMESRESPQKREGARGRPADIANADRDFPRSLLNNSPPFAAIDENAHLPKSLIGKKQRSFRHSYLDFENAVLITVLSVILLILLSLWVFQPFGKQSSWLSEISLFCAGIFAARLTRSLQLIQRNAGRTRVIEAYVDAIAEVAWTEHKPSRGRTMEAEDTRKKFYAEKIYSAIGLTPRK